MEWERIKLTNAKGNNLTIVISKWGITFPDELFKEGDYVEVLVNEENNLLGFNIKKYPNEHTLKPIKPEIGNRRKVITRRFRKFLNENEERIIKKYEKDQNGIYIIKYKD